MRKVLTGEVVAAAVIAAGSTAASAAGGSGYFWPRWVWFGLGLGLALQAAVTRVRRREPGRRRRLAITRAILGVLAVGDVFVWLFSGRGFFFPVFSWLVYLLIYGVHLALERRDQELIDRLISTRRSALDAQAQELRRIERDLHDGAQARLVSVAMTIGLAESLLDRDPETARTLLAEARSGTQTALEDLRDVMQSVHPSVLADRGLAGAVEALALDLAVPVAVHAELTGDAPPAVESAVYFAVAECLANVVKHSGASRAGVRLTYRAGRVVAEVTDDGRGGAAAANGTGLAGIVRRLEGFDGMMTVDSPPGGPTTITLGVPCALSLRRTSPSSATG